MGKHQLVFLACSIAATAAVFVAVGAEAEVSGAKSAAQALRLCVQIAERDCAPERAALIQANPQAAKLLPRFEHDARAFAR